MEISLSQEIFAVQKGQDLAMFKKGFKTSQSSQLKNSEARKLKESLLKRFGNIVPQEFDTIWSSKAKVSKAKVANSYIIIYYLNNEVIYTCWSIYKVSHLTSLLLLI